MKRHPFRKITIDDEIYHWRVMTHYDGYSFDGFMLSVYKDKKFVCETLFEKGKIVLPSDVRVEILKIKKGTE